MLGCNWPLPIAILMGDPIPISLFLLSLGLLWLVWRNTSATYASAPLIVALCALGYLVASIQIGLILSQALRQAPMDETLRLSGRIASMPKYARGHIRFLLDVHAVDGDKKHTGLCYIYIKSPAAQLPERNSGVSSQLCLGERISLLAQLEEVGAAANYGQFDYRAYLMQRGTVLTAYSYSQEYLRRLDRHPPRLYSLLNRLREHLTSTLSAGLPENLGDLAVSVVYGDKITDLADSTREQFRRAGLTHILVASGTQVSLLIVMLALFFSRAVAGSYTRGSLIGLAQFSITLLVVLVYAAITGFETSILRAFIMGGLVLVAQFVNRQADGLSTLAQAGIILLLMNPLQLLAPGTQLSFGATFGLIYAAGVFFPLLTRLPVMPKRILQTLVTTGGAQLFVFPLLAAHFQQLSIWGLLSNLAAIPLAFLLLLVGGLASIGLAAIPGLGLLLRYGVWALAWTLDQVATLFAALPGANLAVPHPPWWWLAAAFVLFISIGEAIKLWGNWGVLELRLLRLQFATALILLVPATIWWLVVPRPQLAVLALNNCEAYLWQPYSGGSYLIARAKGLERSHNSDTLLSALRWRGINRLSALVWLDGAASQPQQHELALLPQATLDALTQDSDCGPLDCAGQTIGARCALGSSELWILWGKPEAPEQFETVLQQCRPRVIVVNQKTWNRLGKEQRSSLLTTSTACVVNLHAVPSQGSQLLVTASELVARPVRGQLRMHCKPSAP